jgi:hypothetical protein
MIQTFRFDDVSVNTDPTRLIYMVDTIRDYAPEARFIFAVSPIVFEGVGERVHPTILTAGSLLSPYYRGTLAGLPAILPDLRQRGAIAGHGLLHVDHRLLPYAAKEMSIIASCALARAVIFVPPYNKWDAEVEAICSVNGIKLVKFEDGWLHAKYGPYKRDHERYYLHTFDFSTGDLRAWLKGADDEA